MLTIRLQRVGRKNTPHFRVVATDSKNPPRGKFLEVVGSYDPRTKRVALQADAIKGYLARGATCSDTAWNLLRREGVVPGTKRAIKSAKHKPGAASAPAVSPAEPEAVAAEPAAEATS